MNIAAVRQSSLYDELCALPEGVTGEIINGELHAMPRPSGRHGFAESALNVDLGGHLALVGAVRVAGGLSPSRKSILTQSNSP